MYRAKYVQQLRSKGIDDKALIESLFAKQWVVYAKRPFGGPQQVIGYLGRYTHKVAISNHRIVGVDESQVSFRYKDYKAAGAKSQMTLSNVSLRPIHICGLTVLLYWVIFSSYVAGDL